VAAAEAIRELEMVAADHPALGLLRAQLAFVEAANAEPDVPGLRARLERDPADAAARHALRRITRWPATLPPPAPSGSN